jgi:hypothetical protein
MKKRISHSKAFITEQWFKSTCGWVLKVQTYCKSTNTVKWMSTDNFYAMLTKENIGDYEIFYRFPKSPVRNSYVFCLRPNFPDNPILDCTSFHQFALELIEIPANDFNPVVSHFYGDK